MRRTDRPDRTIRRLDRARLMTFVWVVVASAFVTTVPNLLVAQERPRPIVELTASARTKVVKLFGAGGAKGLEAYQTGVLISDEGHVLTAWSHVLDADTVATFLDDGQRYEATLLGYDPRTEIAILKIDAQGLPHFVLDESMRVPEPGELILALTNLYGVATGNEPASVQHGTVTAVRSLEGDRIGGRLPYRGPVIVTDAITSNPGTPGGAIVDASGNLLGLVGKDLKADDADIWLNYALPIAELRRSIDDILAGKLLLAFEEDRPEVSEPMTLELLGMELVPDVVGRTPPFVDRVARGSAAERAGVRPDDLILFVDDRLVASRSQVETVLSRIHRDDLLVLTLQRGTATVTVELEIR